MAKYSLENEFGILEVETHLFDDHRFRNRAVYAAATLELLM